MDYLMCGGDVTKYDGIESKLVLGRHREPPIGFSIIIPTYKRVSSLREAIQSALNQRYSQWYEIVIVDNNADDELVFQKVYGLISSFQDDRIVYYRNEKNIGIYGNTLRAGQLAKGARIVLLNDDDILHPMYLRAISGFVAKFHYTGVIGTIPAEFREGEYHFEKPRGGIRAYSISKIEFFFGCTVTSPGLCVPRKIYEEVYNAYDGLLMGDQILQYKALRKYGLVFVDFPLALYRIGENATRKEEILCDMVVHMCQFRHQTAADSLFLKLYCALLEKYFYVWYIDETISFWKMRGIKPRLLERMSIDNISRDRLGYQLNVRIIGKIRGYFSKYRLSHCDVIKKGLDY